MDAVRLAQASLPRNTLSISGHYIEFDMSPYVILNASWNDDTGVVVPGWRDGSIAIIPIPQEVSRVHIALNGMFHRDTRPSEHLTGGAGGVRLYRESPIGNASISRCESQNHPYEYVIYRCTQERYIAVYTRLKWQDYDFDFNETARIRLYSQRSIQPPLPIEVNTTFNLRGLHANEIENNPIISI